MRRMRCLMLRPWRIDLVVDNGGEGLHEFTQLHVVNIAKWQSAVRTWAREDRS